MKFDNKVFFTYFTSIKWCLSYVKNSLQKRGKKPIHIFFCLVDHYEPGNGLVSKDIEIKRVKELLKKYPHIAKNHKDFYGNVPKRSWFFPPHYHRYYNLRNLVTLCEQGYGEIELHLHHGKHKPDTAENLRNTILQCIEEYGIFGIFGESDGAKKYGFIHGDWALDNSRGNKYCGVNNEITILKETGCYADFTHPSLIETNPSQINSIYYATDDPKKPKSYNYGEITKKNGEKTGDIMIIQGPLFPFFMSRKIWNLSILGDVINESTSFSEKRVDAWIKTNICVDGANEAIFVKTHVHGATSKQNLLGKNIGKIYEYLETDYNDGKNYILHYVTSREVYNIIKAIESGKSISEIENYRDYIISKPKYNSYIDVSEASDILKGLVTKTYWD